jgi:hypothetical protein
VKLLCVGVLPMVLLMIIFWGGLIYRAMVKLCAVKGSFGFLHVLIFEGPRGL